MPTKRCTACGFNNPDSRDRCLRCSTTLGNVVLPDGSHAADKSPEYVRESAGKVRRVLNEFWDLVTDTEPPPDISYRWPMGMIGWAFLPGGAQWRTGMKLHAMIIGIPQFLLMVMVFVRFFEADANRWLLAWYLWALWGAALGYQTALKINKRYTIRRFVLATWFALAVSTGFLMFIAQALAYVAGLHLITVLSSDLGPSIKDGDQVLVFRTPFLFGGGAQRGDIVDYTAPAYIVQDTNTGNSTSVTAFRSFGIVSGLPGDKIDWDNSERPKLNGVPFTDALMPLNPEGLMTSGHYDVPPDHYGVLISTGMSEFSLGPSWGGSIGPPRQWESAKWVSANFQEANYAEQRKTLGAVILRYGPPERRAWFGRGNGFNGHR
jgi:hypothetical protein